MQQFDLKITVDDLLHTSVTEMIEAGKYCVLGTSHLSFLDLGVWSMQ